MHSAESAAQQGTTFDHSKFDTLLKTYVQNGKVNYAALKQDKRLDEYLQQLSEADPEALPTREEKIAFWINAYNAYTLKLVVDNYPIKSITDLSALGYLSLPFDSPWKRKFCKVGGKTYSLDEIEHDILRGKFGEEQIHFAVNCASESCPVLRSEAYTGAKLGAQLREQAEAFLRDSTRNHIKLEGNTLYLSKIFEWYRSDFESKKGSLLKYIAQFFSGEERERLESGNITIKFLDYNWNLNEAK
ncbi:MAG: DUF547 domain-containing protein [Candidatus Thermochlorobacter aerophilum]|uniref:DUF547 domain-containing protein n=1 Tax=Candidatus Thermochlorobacter aerophilus TaxID=1868324 RepID=A0A395M3J2_9BACT|nr:MAG: DUF547 domain-containing protein [Candidatus Thermochlorobacter aerophilum]